MARLESKDFTVTFSVDQSPKEVYDAINNVRGWWSGEILGGVDKVGAEFSYRYGDAHFSEQKVTELVPGKKVVWRVTDAKLSFDKQDEWIGTDIVFDIAKKGDKTEVHFTHAGLIPAFQCYGDCSTAWSTLVRGNLRRLITTGKAQPDAFAESAGREGLLRELLGGPVSEGSLRCHQQRSRLVVGRDRRKHRQAGRRVRLPLQGRPSLQDADNGARSRETKVAWLVLDNYFNFIADRPSGRARRSTSRSPGRAARRKSTSRTWVSCPNTSVTASAQTRGAPTSTAVLRS